MNKLSQVRVKRKGQVTIPLKLGSKLGIEEGATLEVKETEGAIVLRPTPRLKGGKVVGERGYRQVIRELDRLRRDWSGRHTAAAYPRIPTKRRD